MIYGTGIDLVKVDRFAQACQRYPQRVWKKICNGPCPSVVCPKQVAKFFSAKESFAKATGIGLRYPVLLSSIHLMNDSLGRPYLLFWGHLNHWMIERRLKAHISISDDGDYVIAQAILVIDS